MGRDDELSGEMPVKNSHAGCEKTNLYRRGEKMDWKQIFRHSLSSGLGMLRPEPGRWQWK